MSCILYIVYNILAVQYGISAKHGDRIPREWSARDTISHYKSTRLL